MLLAPLKVVEKNHVNVLLNVYPCFILCVNYPCQCFVKYHMPAIQKRCFVIAPRPQARSSFCLLYYFCPWARLLSINPFDLQLKLIWNQELLPISIM
jgi:hypothetical protein